MKTPEEVRADLNAARAEHRNRWGLFKTIGATAGPWCMQDWQINEASDDDAAWRALVDEYVETYTRYMDMMKEWPR
jgi:hypothetical protein